MNPLSQLGRISGLPTPVKVVAGVFTGGSMLGAVWFFLGDSPNRKFAMMILTIGFILVFLLYMGFKAIVNMMKKRKASPLSQGLAGNAAAAPQGISEPARRARLDDLRRNFEQGCEKFRAAGKNLYSVPWYVLVGEPGSGKTEAIRHCNVGFPPGLQDQLQGAGGTLNMNWWFTNSAIILDTAGRLMFEEVPPGSTNEWAEFLKLLKQNRPNCPINGMLLVIPVDTLIKDSADAIEKKAGKIAQQFDQIQRTLGVRFPVFVIISKCDLLNGFREFFDDLNDPQLQHQIMGWSNPAALDERFDPAQVTNHLETVKTRLFERRQNLLLDPVHTEDPQARRVEQVDALYALPDSLVKIGPRLRRYLEMIFVAGEWSPKPLFLRGIYFTSSMTEGAALDAELAEALGVPVDTLPGGAIFRKDRAYFLRDLFLEKVFREKGLVTRASNADKQQQTRRLIVMGFGFVAVLALIAITFFSASALRSSIGTQRNWWDAAAGLNPDAIQIINPVRENAYASDASIPIGGKPVSLSHLFTDNLQQVKDPIHIPAVFKPMTVLSANVNVERRDAYRALYERTVLRPAYAAVRTTMQGADQKSWDPVNGTAALAQLMKLEYAKALDGKTPDTKGVESPRVDLQSLFGYIYAAPEAADNLKNFQNDRKGLQEVADWIYTPEAHGEKAWPPEGLAPGSPASLQAIKAGLDATVAYWKSQGDDNGKAMQNINNVRTALAAFRDAEAALAVATKGQTIDKIEAYHSYRDDVWRKQMDILRGSAKAAADAWTAATNGKPEPESLKTLYQDQKNRVAADGQKAIDALLALTPPADAAKSNPSYQALADARTQLEQAKAAIANSAPKATLDDMAALDAAYFGRTIKGLDKEKADRHRFEVHAQLYELADKMVIADDASVTLSGSMSAAFTQTDKDYSDAVGTLRQPLFQGGEALNQAGAVAQFTIEASARAKKYLLADAALKEMPDTAEKWEKVVQAASTKAGSSDALRRPPVPAVTFIKSDKFADDEKTFSQMYAPDIAGEVADKLDTIGKIAAAGDAATKILNPADLTARAASARTGFSAYRDKYIDYWRNTTKDELVFNYPDFKQLHDKLNDSATEANIFEQLKVYGDRMVFALNRVGAADEANAIKLAPQLSREECKQALAGWTNLGDDAIQVRRAILGMIANDFKENYTVVSAKANDSYVARYWNNLPVAALGVLVNEGRKQIQDGITELAGYERFPLAPPGDKKEDLTLNDILAARKALEKIRGAATGVVSAPPPGATATPGTRAISQGGLTSNKDIDGQLELLRGTNLIHQKQAYFDQLDHFLAGLPLDNKPLPVTLTVDKKKLASITDSVSNRYSFMPISQGGKQLRVANLISTTNTDDCTLEYAGGDVVMGFRETPDGPILQPETFAGPWGIFRLIRSPNVKSITRDGNKWSIEYTVTTPDKRNYSLWLVMEFKQPIPDVKDWPVPPGKGGN